jgi:hypothetical protein
MRSISCFGWPREQTGARAVMGGILPVGKGAAGERAEDGGGIALPPACMPPVG